MTAFYRPEKTGSGRKTQLWLNNKYDAKEAAKTLNWIHSLTPSCTDLPQVLTEAVEQIPRDLTSVEAVDYHNYLKSGLVFGYLMACLDMDLAEKIASLRSWKVPKHPSFQVIAERARICLFVKFMTEFGVSQINLFEIEQLYENTNIWQVVLCLTALGLKAQTRPDYKGLRDFWSYNKTSAKATSEQLAALGLCKYNFKNGEKFGSHYSTKSHIR